jgi:predicted FMN-binding regulatory protein PaiB
MLEMRKRFPHVSLVRCTFNDSENTLKGLHSSVIVYGPDNVVKAEWYSIHTTHYEIATTHYKIATTHFEIAKYKILAELTDTTTQEHELDNTTVSDTNDTYTYWPTAITNKHTL